MNDQQPSQVSRVSYLTLICVLSLPALCLGQDQMDLSGRLGVTKGQFVLTLDKEISITKGENVTSTKRVQVAGVDVSKIGILQQQVGQEIKLSGEVAPAIARDHFEKLVIYPDSIPNAKVTTKHLIVPSVTQIVPVQTNINEGDSGNTVNVFGQGFVQKNSGQVKEQPEREITPPDTKVVKDTNSVVIPALVPDPTPEENRKTIVGIIPPTPDTTPPLETRDLDEKAARELLGQGLKFEGSGDRDKAILVYRQVVDRFPATDAALKAIEREAKVIENIKAMARDGLNRYR